MFIQHNLMSLNSFRNREINRKKMGVTWKNSHLVSVLTERAMTRQDWLFQKVCGL